MGENEKLGFTCEEVPFDFSTFNMLFGATTFWFDEGSSTFPKVYRDSLYPPMSPSPYKDEKCYAYNVKTHEKHLVRNPCTHKLRKKHYKPKFTL